MSDRDAPGRPAPTSIVEVKRAFDGAIEQRFDCDLIEATPARVIVRFRFERDGRRLDSYGFFWRRRSYNCYYVVPRGGGPPVFLRFDVVADVEVDLVSTPAEVRYRDLLLDLWVDDAGARWEDEDELEAAIRTGALSGAEMCSIDATRTLLERRHRRVAAAVRSTLRGLGLVP